MSEKLNFKSAYEQLDGIVWIPRMLEKIRMKDQGELPEEYHSYLGQGFDERCVLFLHVSYEDIVQHVQNGYSDREVLDWCYENGRKPTEHEIFVWNEFMTKRGWRDTNAPESDFLDYKTEFGLGDRSDILTYFDFLEIDEGRKG